MTPMLSPLRVFATNARARSRRSHLWVRLGTALFAFLVAAACTINNALADESGVSFWIPGFYGSLAATPQQPGWSLATIYYHTDVSASGSAAVARQIQIGQLPPTTASISGSANVHGIADLGFVIPSYVFATPFLGGQAAASLLMGYGNNNTSLNATATATIDHLPPFSASIARQQDTMGFAELVPNFAIRWNAGVNNYMTYITGDIPVGAYDSTRLSNIGIGHGAVDAGFGYTYFNQKTGHEFSGVLGFTYNMTNQSTQYQNGVDLHFDWGASQFLTKQFQIGLVGYVYDEISCDSGSGDRVGCFKSRVIGVGPQVGFIIPISTTTQGYLNLKGYKEFDNANRADGWNAWVTFVLSPAQQTPSASSTTRRMRSM